MKRCLSLEIYEWLRKTQWSIIKKETFYSHLNMENITEANCPHAKRVCKDFEIKNEEEYRDLYVQSNTLLLPDVFENFKNMFLEIYGLGSFKISFSFWISIASSFKKKQSKMRSFNWYRYAVNSRKRYEMLG